MDGLLDFLKSPAGQGLLSAGFGYLANAQRGTPFNNLGRAGMSGLMGYGHALDRQQVEQENAQQRQMRQLQMDQLVRQGKRQDRQDTVLQGVADAFQGKGPYYKPPTGPSLPGFRIDPISGESQAASPGTPGGIDKPALLGALMQVAPDVAVKQLFKEPVKPQLVTVQTPNGPVQRWVRPGEANGVDVGPAAEKEAALPWYVRRGPDGAINIDPAYAKFEQAKAAAGRPVTPFFQAIPTPQGVMSFDSRSGRMAPVAVNGAPVMKSADDPELQGKLAGAKEEAKTKAEAQAKREFNMGGVSAIMDEAERILSERKATSSMIGRGIDLAASTVGVSPRGAAEADQLKVLGGNLVSKMPRMEGPQSNYDVQLYKEMAGDVGNPMLPIDRRLAALSTLRGLVSKYDKQQAATPTDSSQIGAPPPGAVRLKR